MLYDDLAEITSDLEWAFLQVRVKVREDCLALRRADVALERLSAIVAELAAEGEMRSELSA